MPKLVVVSSANAANPAYDIATAVFTYQAIYAKTFGRYSSATNQRVTWEANSISWYSMGAYSGTSSTTAAEDYQLNKDGYTYFWVAIG